MFEAGEFLNQLVMRLFSWNEIVMSKKSMEMLIKCQLKSVVIVIEFVNTIVYLIFTS